MTKLNIIKGAPSDPFTTLDAALAAIAVKLRDRFAEQDQNRFDLKIELSGKAHGSEPAQLTYSISDSEYGDRVRGNDLHAAITELFRRKGWNKQHAPAQITFAGQLTNDEEAA